MKRSFVFIAVVAGCSSPPAAVPPRASGPPTGAAPTYGDPPPPVTPPARPAVAPTPVTPPPVAPPAAPVPAASPPDAASLTPEPAKLVPVAGESGGGAVANAAEVVAGMKGRFRRCYNFALPAHPEMQGSVMLVALIGADGGVVGVGGQGGPLAPIVPCLKAVLSNGAFSPPSNGVGATVSVPITFILDK